MPQEPGHEVDVLHWPDIGFYVEATEDEPQGGEGRRFSVSFKVWRCDQCGNEGVTAGAKALLIDSCNGLMDEKSDDELFLDGHVKWDGCSNFHFPDSCYHFCRVKDAAAVGVLLQRLYEHAAAVLEDYGHHDVLGD